MTHGHIAAWRRLQRVSCDHAMALAGPKPFSSGRLNRRQIGVPEVIRENVDILGRGSEEEVKARLNWYVTFHPWIFGES